MWRGSPKEQRTVLPQRRQGAKSRKENLCAFAFFWESPCFQSRACDFLVVEMKNFAPDNLIVLVSLAGDQHEVAGTCFGDRLVNCFAAIGDLAVGFAGLFDSLFRVGQDLFGIFRAWIVGSQNNHVAQTAR